MSPRKKESVISRSPLIDCLRGTSAMAAYATLFKDVTVSMVVHLAFYAIQKPMLQPTNGFEHYLRRLAQSRSRKQLNCCL